MLRPEQMAKVSVTGSRAVMPDVIETLHELGLVHLSDYDGSWDGFDNGNPIEGADAASEKLVTVRALESTLGVDPDEVDPQETLADDWEERLEQLRVRVNDLDDERSETREELRRVEERIDRLAPFAELGIDLELLSGYESIDLVVGEGDPAAIEAALEAADAVEAYETFVGGDVVAIAAAPSSDGRPRAADTDGLIADALVSVEFTNYNVPDVDETPGAYLEELESRRGELTTALDDIEMDVDEIATETGPFLRAIEIELSIDVERAEAPLRFATTERAFVAEGWIPAATFDELETRLRDAVGQRVEIEEIEIAEYREHGHDGHADEGDRYEDDKHGATAVSKRQVEDDEAEPPKATDGGTNSAAAAGAGGAVTMDDEPPVVLDNLKPAKPFEMMVRMVNQPSYNELDPTLLIFLTYPFAFGFMIGDIGYGLLYMAMGYAMYRGFDSDAGRALGTIGIWAGVFTVIFGYLYDDVFGIHMSDVGLGFLPGAGVLSKGLQLGDWALLWIVLSILFGIVHLNIGLVMGFVNELNHGLKAAVYEKLSWILAMNGLFIWIFAHEDAGSFDHGIGFLPDDLAASGVKPDFLTGTQEGAVLYETQNFALGFAGLPEIVGIVGIAMLLVGSVMVGIGEGIAGIFEIPANAFGHVLSYLRMVAVLLAKGGMAFAVNLLVFGAYETEAGYTYFNYPGLHIEDISGYEYAELSPEFVGLIHAGDGLLLSAIAIVGAIVVFVLGHILVLLLGITAAGIQMLRLEYVEFFQKFYDGSGEEYEPFGGDGAPQAAD
ncbi:V-type ATP synthase subunit I [Halovivax gelatinilyticus]|uniref:V-type ATP synthase subunit I n=1 Tax=Halovivax gelatinilyticus TaxID=2961597 RepID=UPI0020CA5415|nr:V-type ATP synthase subunit I [Halovivax gelatinilyticus]